MKKTWKLMNLALASMLATSTLVSCGDSEKTSASNSQENTSSTTSAVSEGSDTLLAEPMTIT